MKPILLFLAALVLPAFGQTGTLISQLPTPSGALSDTDLFPDTQGYSGTGTGATVKVTAAQMKAYMAAAFQPINGNLTLWSAVAPTSYETAAAATGAFAPITGSTSYAPIYTTTQAGNANEVWVGIRTDGQSGHGTSAADPLDGSYVSASNPTKMDSIFAGLGTNTVIHLAPGTYKIHEGAFTVKSGWTIAGAGRGVTTIQLVGINAAQNNHDVLSGTSVNGVTIRDLTIDANAPTLALSGAHAHDSISAVALQGDHNLLRWVEGINGYGDTVSGNENIMFFLIGASSSSIGDNHMEDCWAHSYMAATGGTAYTNGFDMYLSNNSSVDYCVDQGANHSFSGAGNNLTFFADSNDNSSTTGNGWYLDTGGMSNSTIEACTFNGTVIPIQFNSASACSHNNIVDNTLISTNTTTSGNCAIAFSGSAGGSFDEQIARNHYSSSSANTGLILDNGNGGTPPAGGLNVDGNIIAGTNLGLIGYGGATTDLYNATNSIGRNYYNGAWHDSINGAAPPQTISAATTYTLARQADNSSLTIVLGAGSGAYTANIALSDTGCRPGDITYVNVTWPTSTNPALNFYDGSTSGTLIAGPVLSTVVGGSSTLQFQFNGTAWVHYSKGELATRNLGANVQTALAAPLGASTGVLGYTQPFDAAEHYDGFNHALSSSSSADTTFTADDGSTWTASAEYLGAYPQTAYDPPVITNPTVNGSTLPSLGGTTGTGVYYVYSPDLANPVKNIGATFYFGSSTGSATNYTGGCLIVGDHNLTDCVHISFARAYCQVQLPTVHGGIGTLRTLYTMYFSHNTGSDILKTDGTIYNLSVVMHGNQLTVSMAGQSYTLSDAEVGVVTAMASPRVQCEEYNGSPGTANSDKLYYTKVYANGVSPYIPGRDVQAWSEMLDALTQEHTILGPLLVNSGRNLLPGGAYAGYVIPVSGSTFHNSGNGDDQGWHFTQVYGTGGYAAGPFIYNESSVSGTATSSTNIATDFSPWTLTPTEYVITVTAASGVTTGPTVTLAGTSYSLSGMTMAGQTYYVPLTGRVGATITSGSGINFSVTTAATGTSPSETLRVDTIGYVQ